MFSSGFFLGGGLIPHKGDGNSRWKGTRISIFVGVTLIYFYPKIYHNKKYTGFRFVIVILY